VPEIVSVPCSTDGYGGGNKASGPKTNRSHIFCGQDMVFVVDVMLY
jgi:hypothetical protein